jgi:hypothetical protein
VRTEDGDSISDAISVSLHFIPESAEIQSTRLVQQYLSTSRHNSLQSPFISPSSPMPIHLSHYPHIHFAPNTCYLHPQSDISISLSSSSSASPSALSSFGALIRYVPSNFAIISLFPFAYEIFYPQPVNNEERIRKGWIQYHFLIKEHKIL